MKRITKNIFDEAKPSQKADLIVQGYNHIAERFKVLASEVAILNTWVEQMPGLMAECKAYHPNSMILRSACHQSVIAFDDLMEKTIDNHQEVEHLLHLLSKIQTTLQS